MKKIGVKMLSSVLSMLLLMQAVPVTTYANDNEEVVTETVAEDAATTYSTDQVEEVTIDDVSDQVDIVKDIVEGIPEVVEEVNDTSDDNLSDEGGAPASREVIENVPEEAKNPDASVTEDIKENLDEIKDNLDVIKQTEEDITTNLSPAVDAAIAVDNKADEIVTDVNTTNEEVDKLIKDIESASDAKEVNNLFEEIDKKVTDAGLNLTQQKDTFESLKDVFDKAIEKLENSNEDLSDELAKAKENAKEIEEKLSTRDTQIENLQDATSIASGTLSSDKDAADNLEEKITENSNNKKLSSWEKARNKMYLILENYYIPQFVDKDATNISFEYVKGFDTQDLNYNIVKYTDGSGVEHTMYFNYDLVDKVYKEDNLWYHLGTSTNIVIYEKTVDEINADNYLRQYFSGKKINVKNYANSGKLDVFKYVDADGKTAYMVREEYEKALKDGTITEKDVTKINVNGNSMAKGGNNYLNETEDKEYNAFLKKTGNLYEKFLSYEEKVDDAKEVVDSAKNEAETLSDALDSLNTNKMNLKVINILTDDELTKLESVMTEDEMASLETMTVSQAITFLKNLVQKAQEKVDNAVITYNKVVEKRDEIKKELPPEIVAGDITAPETNDNNEEGSTSSTSSGNDEITNVTTPSSQASLPSTLPVLSWENTKSSAKNTPVLSKTFVNDTFANGSKDVLNDNADKTADDNMLVAANNVKPAITTNTKEKTSSVVTASPSYNYWWILFILLLIAMYIIYRKFKAAKEN